MLEGRGGVLAIALFACAALTLAGCLGSQQGSPTEPSGIPIEDIDPQGTQENATGKDESSGSNRSSAPNATAGSGNTSKETGDPPNGSTDRGLAYRPGGPLLAETNVPGSLPEPSNHGLGREAAIPRLEVAEDGTLFFGATRFRDLPATNFTRPELDILRSEDDGKTWTDVSLHLADDANEPPFTVDPGLELDGATGRLFALNLAPSFCSHLAWSDDAGGSWSRNPNACLAPPQDRPFVTTGPPRTSETVGYPNVVYVCYNQFADTHCMRSLDGGRTFHPAGTPHQAPDTEEGSVCGTVPGEIEAGPEGRVYVPTASCGRPLVATSADDGTTWTRVNVAPDTGHIDPSSGPAPLPDLTVDDVGNVYLSWIGTDGLPYLAWSPPGGEDWSDPIPVAPPNATASNLPAVAASGDGQVAVSFLATTHPDGYPANDTAGVNVTWDGFVVGAPDARAPNPLLYASRVNPAEDPLVRGACGPEARCDYALYMIDVEIGPKGRPWAALTDRCTGSCVGPDVTSEDLPSDVDGYRGLVSTWTRGPRLG